MIKTKHIETGSADEASPDRLICGYIKRIGLRSGDRLPTHDELCGKLGIGIRRLREGLSVLRQQGLVVTRRRGGTVLGSLSMEPFKDPIGRHLDEKGCSLENLIRARAVVESSSAAEAARFRKAKDMLAMLDCVERMEAAVPASSGKGVSDGQLHQAELADEQFHQAVLKGTNNPVLQIFGELIRDQFKHKLKEQKSAMAAQKSLRQHKQIFKAIQDQDAELAQKTMWEHIIGQLDEMPVPVEKRRKG
ncbi:MAG: FCD domain-containing protein [Victivallales bacterium]